MCWYTGIAEYPSLEGVDCVNQEFVMFVFLYLRVHVFITIYSSFEIRCLMIENVMHIQCNAISSGSMAWKIPFANLQNVIHMLCKPNMHGFPHVHPLPANAADMRAYKSAC